MIEAQVEEFNISKKQLISIYTQLKTFYVEFLAVFPNGGIAYRLWCQNVIALGC
jgi:hypothetical protein